MKANKVTVTITVEVLDIDSAPASIHDCARAIHDQNPHGELTSVDGDTVKWETKTEEVEF
jgi:hypothetical protein